MAPLKPNHVTKCLSHYMDPAPSVTPEAAALLLKVYGSFVAKATSGLKSKTKAATLEELADHIKDEEYLKSIPVLDIAREISEVKPTVQELLKSNSKSSAAALAELQAEQDNLLGSSKSINVTFS